MLWLHRLAEGSDEAAEQIWNRYFQDLVRLADRKLGKLPRRDADAEDVAISALKSFYHGMQENRFAALSDRRELWNLLFVITARKAHKQARKQKRKGATVVGESALLRRSAAGDELGGIGQVLGREPTPELAFAFAETCREMLDGLQDDKLKQVAVLKLEGYTNPQIAERMGCTLRTVERKLNRIRSKWEPDEGRA
jgi:RNA polymerase sigma factor (sigma-70 family)